MLRLLILLCALSSVALLLGFPHLARGAAVAAAGVLALIAGAFLVFIVGAALARPTRNLFPDPD